MPEPKRTARERISAETVAGRRYYDVDEGAARHAPNTPTVITTTKRAARRPITGKPPTKYTTSRKRKSRGTASRPRTPPASAGWPTRTPTKWRRGTTRKTAWTEGFRA
jgi:hypothetical protein